MAVVVSILSFFFFKQKTAYEMRISDWSSDVCSSDLDARAGAGDGKGIFRRVDSGSGGVFRRIQVLRRPTELQKSSVFAAPSHREIGRASCRERVCQYV